MSVVKVPKNENKGNPRKSEPRSVLGLGCAGGADQDRLQDPAVPALREQDQPAARGWLRRASRAIVSPSSFQRC